VPPTVSILLPVFNAAQTLALSLKSIRRQTLTDWECILVDDGSTDGSIEIARAVAASDSRFNVIQRDHSGLIESLNAGIDQCSARLVARMDSDDWMRRERLELQTHALDDASIEIAGTHVRTFPRSGLGTGSREYEAWLNSIRSPADVYRDRFIECALAHPSWMLRRATLERERYRDRGWPEDYDLLLRLLEKGPHATVVPRRLLSWRQHPGRLSCHDERYSLERFTACRAAFLAADFLRQNERFLLWGYGQTGRALCRALAAHGKRPSGLIEVHPRRLGQTIQGAPVVCPDDIDRLPSDPLIVSVSGVRPRTEIRQKLAALGRVEVRDYVCAA
jgi:glycosyltransferase involved in cell wall biosynthesis